MAMQTDVSVKSLASSNTIYGGRTRVRGVLVTPGSANGSVTLKDGGLGGTTILTIPTIANGESFNVDIPGNGVLFQTDVYATLAGTGTAVTVFYG